VKTLFLILSGLISLTAWSTPDSNKWEGRSLPQFELLNQSGELINSVQYKGKWLVLYFYPKDKTPGCTIEAQNFTNDYARYQQLNTEIVGVSLDDVESHKDFAETYELPFNLLADTESKLSKTMEVKRFLPWPHASRQTFLIDPKGIIVRHFDEVEPKVHSQQLLKALQALQQKK